MLEWATDYFKENEVPSPRLSIEWILAEVLGVKRLDLYMAFDRPLTQAELEQLRPLIKRRAGHEPLQYVTGSTDFYNLNLTLTPDVLIPRPETEELVTMILDVEPVDKPISILDIGTGSGCIALAIKKERPHWKVTAIDNSEKALQIARQNARRHELDVTFHQSSFQLWQTNHKWNVIVSNPPYIHEEEIDELADQVIKFEPRNALITEDVLAMYRELMGFSKRHLEPDGSFYFEINENEGPNLLKILNTSPFECRLENDISNRTRFIIGKRT